MSNSGKGVASSSRPPPKPRPFGRDPALSSFINARALGKPEGVPFQELVKALFDSINGDKNNKQNLQGILTRLFYYEELPPNIVQLLAPLLQNSSKDARVLRSLYYLLEVYVGAGSAGTPTLYDPALVGKRPDDKAMQAILSEVKTVLEQPDAHPAIKRATFVLLAAAARGNDSLRKDLVKQVQRAISAADSLASMASASTKGKASPAKPAVLDWDLQHTAFLTVRLSGAATGSDPLSRTCFVGVGSADPVGARHALALAADLAYRDAGFVVREMSGLVAAAVKQYEASGAGPLQTPGESVNLEDSWARLYLARTCALVVHSDQSSGDVSRGGAPFWQMLHLLAIRDSVDLVRFGALEAMTGWVPWAGGAALGAGANVGGAGSSKTAKLALSAGASGALGSQEDRVFQQRRGRAWRLLVAQGGLQVSIPGAKGAASAPMKLFECIGRLLLAAVRSSAQRPTRYVAACTVVASLAESCLASQSVGSSRHNTSPDCDRVLGGLAAGLAASLEGDVSPAQRCACLEALLYLQAAGYPTGLTPAKVVAAAGGGGAGWVGGLQDSLLSAVLKCAKARPKLATAFLGYATAVVGISPVGIDLSKVTGLWDAAVAAGREGKEAALASALGALQSPAPSSTQHRAGNAEDGDVTRAVREEDGWNAFVCTAAWWVGENANPLCGEFSGRKIPFDSRTDVSNATAGAEALEITSGRNPMLSRILRTLQSVALTAVWQVRLAAAQAVAKIAVRSGEPFRLQCYSILASCGGSGADHLGLQSATAPALAVLDRVYATQAVLDDLWREHGDDVEGWPPEVLDSLRRRNKQIMLQVERYVCRVPKERYAVLGHRALSVLAAGKEGEEEGMGGMASLLTQQLSEEGQQEAGTGMSDRTGSELAKTKNREIESILSGSDDGTTFKNFTSARSDISATIDDKNKEIESLLSGGASAVDPWAGNTSGSHPSFNAFLEGEGQSEGPSFSTYPEPEQETPRMGAVAGDSSSGWFREEQQPQVQSPSGATPQLRGPGARTGTVLHMFVADYNQPEELSVFEGDQVEVLEESEGWMLVRDPSGSQGLVPTSYIRMDGPPLASHRRNSFGGDVMEGRDSSQWAPPPQPQVQTRGHARKGSLDYSTSKEDYLDNIFNAAPFAGEPALPTTPEDGPLAGQAEDARLFRGASSAAAQQGWDLRRDDTGSGRVDQAQVLTAHTGDSWGGEPTSATAAVAPPASGVFRQGSGNPFTPSHRRTMSGASSSHRRSLSAGSVDMGSLPVTPTRMEGQERTIVADFTAEEDGELTVAPGERVKVHSDIQGWVRVLRLSDHRTGLVPSWAVGAE